MDKRKAAKLQMQEQINALMTEYSRCRKAGEPKLRLKLIAEQVYLLINTNADTPCSRELYSKVSSFLKGNRHLSNMYDPGDIINDCFLTMLGTYDDERNPNFWAYFHTFVKHRLIDTFRKDLTQHTNEDGTVEKIPRKVGSLEDMSDCPDPEQTIELPDTTADQMIAAMLSLVVRFEQHLPGRSATPTRLLYFRCFVTDYMICISRADGILEAVEINEHEAFEAMDGRLLEFVLEAPCRTLLQIRAAGLRTYEALEIPAHSGPVKLPLEGFVLLRYLLVCHEKQVTDSAVSEQRKLFEQLLGIDGKKHTWQLSSLQPAQA